MIRLRDIDVFISYSSKDEAFRRKLENHLAPLERQGTISVWHAGRLAAGANRNEETARHLNQADVFLVLVSPDYLNSEYNYGVELRRMLERRTSDGIYVIPIILRPCDLKSTALEGIQALPSNDRPVSKWDTQDAAFSEVFKGLVKVFDILQKDQQVQPDERLEDNLTGDVQPTQPALSDSANEPIQVQNGASSSQAEALTPVQTNSSNTSSVTTGIQPGQTPNLPPVTEPVIPSTSSTTKEAQPDSMKVTSDRAIHTLEEDRLGFGIWVRALRQFIISPETTTPLTIGIDGPWGTGKTSFMYMLQGKLEEREEGCGLRWLLWFSLTYPVWLTGKLRVLLRGKYSLEIAEGLSYDPDFDLPVDELCNRNPELSSRQIYWAKIAKKHCPRTPQSNPTIWFDAWKFEQEEQLWSALALVVLEQIKKKYNWLYRLDFWRRLAFKRFSWLKALSTLVLKFLLPIVLAVIAWKFNVFIQVATKAYPSSLEKLQAFQPLAQGLLGIGAFISGFLQVSNIVSNPFQIPVKQIFDRPNYEEKVGFINGFEEDFANIVSVITRPRLGWKSRKLVIFIDDLDRCKPPKSVDIIEAINLFLGCEQCVFVMGVDTSAVVASVETKYKDLFDQIHRGRAKVVSEGRFFLEKIIQVPLRIPPITEDGITRLIEGITAQGIRPLQRPDPAALALSAPIGSHQRPDTDALSLPTSSVPDTSASYSHQEVREAIQEGAQLVRDNPRQVKRFVNLFRLSIYVLNEQKLFEEQNNVGLTMKRLAIWVAWSVRWGELVRYLIEEMPSRSKNSDLLDLLVEMADCLDDNWNWSVNSGVQPNLTLLDKIYNCRNSDGHNPFHWCVFPWEQWLGELGFRRSIKELEMFWLPPSSNIDWLRSLLLTTRVTHISPVLSVNNGDQLP